MSVCICCEEALFITIGDDNEQYADAEDHVPDDLELACGCHYHWQCLMDQASALVISLQCPNCRKYLAENGPGSSRTNPFFQASNGARIVARYSNEGGNHQELDILPNITEEAYIESHPEARPAQALHVMCAEGDVGGILELLKDTSEEGIDPGFLVRYQNPLTEEKSGLHLAVENSQEEVIWLLLWLSSELPSKSFPPRAIEVANAMGTGRLKVGSTEDVRQLKDSRGRTALDLLRELHGDDSIFVEQGILNHAPSA